MGFQTKKGIFSDMFGDFLCFFFGNFGGWKNNHSIKNINFECFPVNNIFLKPIKFQRLPAF